MRGAVAVLSGVAAAVAAALPLAWIGHGLHPWSSWCSLGVGVGVAVTAYRSVDGTTIARQVTPVGWFMIAVYALASARAFSRLIYPDGDSWKVFSPNNLGDLPLHLSLIRWLAAAPRWWPASPILAGDPLRYPPGSDLFNALLLSAGVPAEQGLIWCGLGGAFLTGITLWRWGGSIALAAFLFSGGCGAVLFVSKGWGVDPEAVSQWKNLFLALFVTQRGFLYALPAGFLLLSSWREAMKENGGAGGVPPWVQILMLSTLPLFSVHAALFLGVMMVGLFLLAPVLRTHLLLLTGCSWPVMALFGWMVTSGCGGPSAFGGIGWQPGWTGDGTVGFWIWNFGIALPLGIALCLLLFRRGAPEATRAFVWPAAAVFVGCLFVRFAPWAWDNTKLMIWSWLVIAPFLWSFFFQNLRIAIRCVAVFALFGSGALLLAAGLDGRHGYELVRRSDLDTAASLLHAVHAGAVVACAPEYNQPVLMLGHPVVCGYEGHLWSHGLDYKSRWEALNGIMKGEPGWEQRARSLGVSCIYWGEPEARRWPVSDLPWSREAAPSLHMVQ